MTLRRYAPMKPSRGTVIPDRERRIVHARDRGQCVIRLVGVEHECIPGRELDHVRVGGMGLKSRSTADNLVTCCPIGHRLKTENGRAIRPLLIAYLDNHAAVTAALGRDEP